MAQVLKSTITVTYKNRLLTVEAAQAMEAFCQETVRLIIWTLKNQAERPEDFDGSLSYGWFQIPEERGMYCIQVLGPHMHQDIRKIGDDLQRQADERGIEFDIMVLRE